MSSDRKLIKGLAFVGIVIFGIVWFVISLLNKLEANVPDVLATILNYLRAFALLLIILVVVVVGWEGASGKKLGWQIVYLIFALLAVVGAVLAII